MIARLIEFSVRNRWLVICFWAGIAIWGIYALLRTPVDAIPDLSENQVIVFVDWMGRTPQDIEEQITYPLSVSLQGLPHVKTVRSSSEPNFSMINIIFDDSRGQWEARKDVLERLATIKSTLPPDVTPILAPDATALGQIFWYTVEGDGYSLDELRALQDFTIRYQLTAVPGVAEVAAVGGFVREYQVDVDPAKLRLYKLPLSSLYSAIASSNLSVGGKVITDNKTEYSLRGIGWLRNVTDLENVVVDSRKGVPVRVCDLATVQLGPEFRRSALEKDGREVVGGVVMMRYGGNPLAVTRAIKTTIRELQAGLPEGVRIVPFYERTRLIESAIHTVTGTLREEMIIASIAILLILAHFRSAVVVCLTLPMAVLVSFLLMYYLDIPSNIMSLCGIAISIGILVDAAVVMVENATHELKVHFGDAPVSGDTTEIIVRACRLVGRPIFFSVIIMLISFLPVFALGGQAGKLSHPLAFTKTFAMTGVALMATTLVPAMIPLLIRGRLRGEEQNWIVRSFIHIYKPLLTWIIDRPVLVCWIMAVILSIGASFLGVRLVPWAVLGFGMMLVLGGMLLFGTWRKGLVRQLVPVLTLAAVAFWSDTHFRKLGSEFRPELDEGSIMDMPTSSPRISMAQAVDDVMVRDRVMKAFPEVEQVVGKIGRADTATDPSPLDMVETVITMRPRAWWPKRKLKWEDMIEQAAVVAADMQRRGWIRSDNISGDAWGDAARAILDERYARQHPALTETAGLLNTAGQISMQQLDRSLRELARRRQVEYQPKIAAGLIEMAYQLLIDHLAKLPSRDSAPALRHMPDDATRNAVLEKATRHGVLLVESPRQEEVDKLLATLCAELIRRGQVTDRDDLLLESPGAVGSIVNSVRRAIGDDPPDFAQRVRQAIERRTDELWRERTKTLNWEIFDYAKSAVNSILIDSLLRTAEGTPHFGAMPDAAAIRTAVDQFTNPLASRMFLWQKTKSDIREEFDSELQMPGWGNAWTQPIKNRIDMLATGVRTDVGIKVYGPTGKSLDESIAQLQQVSQRIRETLDPTRGRGVSGATDLFADQILGKRYVEVRIDREKAERYGVKMSDLGEAIETALGGSRVTTTVEGRLRFPVRLRYARDEWQELQAVGDVLVAGQSSAAAANEAPSASMSAAPAGAMGGGMGASPQAQNAAAANPPPMGGRGLVLIPLRTIADIVVTEGPSMIKSENGRLRSYVTLNVRGRDIVGFVEEARAKLKPIEDSLAGTGMSIEWSGEFEQQLKLRQTLILIFPMVIGLILFLLYLTFRDALDMMLVSMAVLGALAGAVMFQAAFGFNFSVIVTIGYIAAFGMATQTGVIMLVYLREAIDRRGGLEKIASLDELRQAVIEGAVHRLRPKLLTEGVAIVGLVPMLWATGTGSEIMRPMAAPVLGGLLISDEVIDVMIPVLFYWIRRWRWMNSRKAKVLS